MKYLALLYGFSKFSILIGDRWSVKTHIWTVVRIFRIWTGVPDVVYLPGNFAFTDFNHDSQPRTTTADFNHGLQTGHSTIKWGAIFPPHFPAQWAHRNVPILKFLAAWISEIPFSAILLIKKKAQQNHFNTCHWLSGPCVHMEVEILFSQISDDYLHQSSNNPICTLQKHIASKEVYEHKNICIASPNCQAGFVTAIFNITI